MKIGVLVDSFRLPVLEGIKKAAALGVTGIQLYATSGETAPKNMTAAKVAQLKDAVAANGMEISAVCGDLGGHGFMEAEQNLWKIEESKRIMDLTLALGAKIVTTHIGIVPENDCAMREVMRKACGALSEYGDAVGAKFAIETGPEPAQVLKSFIDELPGSSVRVNFDPANLVMVLGEDPAEQARILKDYIIHTHAKDGVRLKKVPATAIYRLPGDMRDNLEGIDAFKEVPLGQGEVHFDSYLNALKEIGYTGYLTIEREVGDRPEDDIKEAVDFLKSKIFLA